MSAPHALRASSSRVSAFWRGVLTLLCLSWLAIAPAIAANAGLARSKVAVEPIRILLVGNSLVYFNDLPAHLEAFARAATPRPIEVTMYAGPGHHIDGHAKAGVVSAALKSEAFDWLILQEFGAGLSCDQNMAQIGFDCARSQQAHRQLAAEARAHDVNVLLLGTYQNHAGATRDALRFSSRSIQSLPDHELARAEQALAQALSAGHVSLAAFNACQVAYPYYRWFAPDQSHPGPDLTAMMAIRILQAIGLDPQFSSAVDVAGHGFDRARAPRAIVPHHERDVLPLVATAHWHYAAEVLRHLKDCDLDTAVQMVEACAHQPRCVGREAVWWPTGYDLQKR